MDASQMKRRSFFGSMAAMLAAPSVAKTLASDIEKDIAYDIAPPKLPPVAINIEPIGHDMWFTASSICSPVSRSDWLPYGDDYDERDEER